MTAGSITTLSRGKALALSLRQEGRPEDAQLVDELAQAVERQTRQSQYATTGQVAQQLGVSRQTVVNWIKRGFVPGFRLGARLVVPLAELDRVREIAQLLALVDAERLPATAAEVDSG